MSKEIRRAILLLLLCPILAGCAFVTFSPCVVPAPPAPGDAPVPTAKPDRKGLHAASIDEMLKLPDEEIDIGKGALLIASEYDPAIDVNKHLARLDEMAHALRQKLRGEEDPRARIDTLNRFLFDELRYAFGDKEEHSFLHAVLEQRAGNCAGLSTLYWALAERAGIPLCGMLVTGRCLEKGGIPAGHVFLQYGTGAAAIWIDPTAGGIQIPEFRYRLRLLSLDEGAVRPTNKRQFLGILLSNYSLNCCRRRRYAAAAAAGERACAAAPSLPVGWENLYTAHRMRHDYASCLETLHRCEMLGGTASPRALSLVQDRVARGAGLFSKWAPVQRPFGKILVLPPSLSVHVADPETKRARVERIARDTFSTKGWSPVDMNATPPAAPHSPHEIADLGRNAGADAVCTLDFARYDGSGIGFPGEALGFEGRIFYVMRLFGTSPEEAGTPLVESPRVLRDSRFSVRSGLGRLDDIFADDIASVAAASLWRDSREIEGLRTKTMDGLMNLREEEIDIATAALVIARSVNRNVDVAAYRDRVDAVAASLSCRVSEVGSIRDKIEILGDCLSTRYKCVPGRSGDRLDAVLDRGSGGPLGLAVAYLAVAERLGVPLALTALDGEDVALRYDWRDGALCLDVHGRLTARSPRERLAADPATLSKRHVIALLFAAAGNDLVERKEFTRAHRLLRRALALNPRCAQAWCGQGAAYGRRGQLHKAIEAYGKALEIKPNHADAWNGLVLVTCHKGDRAGAWSHVRKARKLHVKIDEGILKELRDEPRE